MTTRLWFHSERGVTGASSFACTVATTANGYMLATDNEANLNRFDRPIGKLGRLAVVKKGWKAHTAVHPGATTAGQPDVTRMADAMFPKLPNPILKTSRDPRDVWDAIGEYAVALAIDAGAVPPSDAIRRYVNGVGHRGLAIEKRTVKGKRQVKWVDPMHLPSDAYTGHWVDWNSLQKCARAIEHGTLVYELYPVGKWTQANLRTGALKVALAASDKSRDSLRSRARQAEAAVVELTDELAKCQSADAIKNAKASGWEGGLVAGIEALQKLRGQGPA